MNNRRNQLRNIGIVSGLLAVCVGCYVTYKHFTENAPAEIKTKKYTSKSTTIILTDSIVSSNIPINDILKQTNDIVVVIPPGLKITDLKEENNLDYSVIFKVIECDTFEGVWSVVQHLSSDVVFVVKDDLEKEIPSNVGKYVGEIIELEQNAASINQEILSYVLN